MNLTKIMDRYITKGKNILGEQNSSDYTYIWVTN